MKADLCGYEFDIIYRPGPRNSNADALSRNPIIREGEVNPELPRVQLYELATKQEEYDNYNEHDTPTKVLHLTKATKRNRLQAKDDSTETAGGALASSEDSENIRAKKIPNLESSIDSDNPEDTETDGADRTMKSQQRRRKYTKKTTTKTNNHKNQY